MEGHPDANRREFLVSGSQTEAPSAAAPVTEGRIPDGLRGLWPRRLPAAAPPPVRRAMLAGTETLGVSQRYIQPIATTVTVTSAKRVCREICASTCSSLTGTKTATVTASKPLWHAYRAACCRP